MVKLYAANSLYGILVIAPMVKLYAAHSLYGILVIAPTVQLYAAHSLYGILVIEPMVQLYTAHSLYGILVIAPMVKLYSAYIIQYPGLRTNVMAVVGLKKKMGSIKLRIGFEVTFQSVHGKHHNHSAI